ncbi:MAG: hypothetical protein ACTSVV_07915 [Promethearchaeota archaeon]
MFRQLYEKELKINEQLHKIEELIKKFEKKKKELENKLKNGKEARYYSSREGYIKTMG